MPGPGTPPVKQRNDQSVRGRDPKVSLLLLVNERKPMSIGDGFRAGFGVVWGLGFGIVTLGLTVLAGVGVCDRVYAAIEEGRENKAA